MWIWKSERGGRVCVATEVGVATPRLNRQPQIGLQQGLNDPFEVVPPEIVQTVSQHLSATGYS